MRPFQLLILSLLFSLSMNAQLPSVTARRQTNGSFRFYDRATGTPAGAQEWDDAGPFAEGRALVKKNGKATFVGPNGLPITTVFYDDARAFAGGRAAVRRNGRWGFIAPDGREVIALRYHVVRDFKNDKAAACLGDSWLLLAKDGAVLPGTPEEGKRLPQRAAAAAPAARANSALPELLQVAAARTSTFSCPANLDAEAGTFQFWETNVGFTDDLNNINQITLNGSWLPNAGTPGRHQMVDRNTNSIDPYGLFPVNPPTGGRYAIKIGNDGDLGTCTGTPCPDARAEAVRYKIQVPQNATDASLTFSYAVVLENPLAAVNLHENWEQPRFKVRLYDPITNEVLPCANFTFVADGPLPGFFDSPNPKRADARVRCKPWSSVYVNLSNYAGRQLFLEFTTGDCTRKGHFGYAYVDVLTCGISAQAEYDCATPQNSRLVGPPGFQTYEWYNSNFSSVVATGQVATVGVPTTPGTQYWLVATPYPILDCPTCVCRDTVGVTMAAVYPGVDAGPDRRICAASPVQIGTPAQSGLTYQWSPVTALANPASAITTASPTASTEYVLTASTALHCDARDTVRITVDPKPVAAFTVNNNSQCVNNNQFVFTNASTIPAGSFTASWSFGDGGTASTLHATHSYAAPGTYPVRLKLTSDAGCTAEQLLTLTVLPPPAAAYTVAGGAQCLRDNRFAFSIAPAAGISYQWNFGDGNTASGASAIHVYAATGTFPVRLIATNTDGCADTIINPVIVHPMPQAAFAMNTAALPCVNTNNFLFQDASTIAGGSLALLWKFGDGATASIATPAHSYGQPGSYPVQLIATSAFGCADTAIRGIVVHPKPAPAFSINRPGQCVLNNQFVFTASGSIPAGTFTSVWNFGDAASAPGNTATHSYAMPGTYTVWLRLTSDQGCKDSVPQQVVVDPMPVAAFTIATPGNCVNDNRFTFTNGSGIATGSFASQWALGDGSTSTVASPAHSYGAAGTYPVKLVVESINGCRDSVTHPVTIYPVPVPAFSVNQAGQCLQGNIFTGTSNTTLPTGSFATTWNLGDGTIMSQPGFRHSYAQPGTYTIRMLAVSDHGCRDSIDQPVTVHPHPDVQVDGDALRILCRNDSLQLQATGALTWSWSPAQGLSCVTCVAPKAAPLQTRTYYVTGWNAFNCPSTDSVVIDVKQPISVRATGDTICSNAASRLQAQGAASYLWSPATGLSSTVVANPVVAITQTLRYQVVGYDGFNCFTDTAYATVWVNPAPDVNLGADLVLPAGTQYQLLPTINNGPIVQWRWLPSFDLSCVDCPSPLLFVRNERVVVLRATNAFGCMSSDTVAVRPFCDAGQVFFANAFTPNGDGVNDLFFPQSNGAVQVRYFRVFNRWGELVFERNNFVTNEPKFGWDGRNRGVIASPDVYVYTALVVCADKTEFTYKGNVSILK
ncbi:MAG: PKD domain-containing protein [Chitinophagaceae bacterium]|nr:MAG: PKD domain-containing protein [Chitinophagaceae bacterium]